MIKRHMESEAVLQLSFLSRAFIAESPKGVAALPSPIRLAVIFELIYPSSSEDESFFVIRRTTGLKSFDKKFIMSHSVAMFKNPFQKHIITVIFIISEAELSQAFRQAVTVCWTVPFATEQIMEKLIIKVHI